MNTAMHTEPSNPTTRTMTRAEVEAWLPLVWKVARQVARRLPASVDVTDLVGAGTIGLMDATTRFDAAVCDRFGAYAEIRIRGAILDQLREMDFMPRAARNKRKRLDSTQHTLSTKLGRAADVGEVAEALGITVEGVEKMRKDVHSAELARDVDVHNGDIATDGKPSAQSTLEDKEIKARLAAAIGALPERHQQVLSLYYVEDLKLKEIGGLLDVTESRVCQILKDTVARLKASVTDA